MQNKLVGCFTVFVASVFAYATTYTAYLSNDSTIQIVRNGSQIIQIEPAFDLANWLQLTPVSQGFTQSGTGYVCTASYSFSGGVINASTYIVASGSSIKVSVTATPTANVNMAATSLRTDLDDTFFAGAEAVDGTATAILPPTYVKSYVLGGSQLAMSLIAPVGDKFTVTQRQANYIRLEDDRMWVPQFELLAYNGYSSGTWAANTSRTFTITLTAPNPINIAPPGPYTVQQGSNWTPVQPALDVTPGSPLDFSPPVVTPAGSNGRVIVSNGHFALSTNPSVPIRFFGATLADSSATPTHADADALATRLMRLGFNAVRLHSFDNALIQGEPDGVTINPIVLDSLQYLVAALEKRGIFVYLNLYTDRIPPVGEVFPQSVGPQDYKTLLLFDSTTQQDWLSFVTNLLTPVNPYNGYSFANDPGIAWMCPVNENNPGYTFSHSIPAIQSEMQTLFNLAGYPQQWSKLDNQSEAWAIGLQDQEFKTMEAELRALGVKALLTGANGALDPLGLNTIRQDFDFVDDHYYWDPPQYLLNYGQPPFYGGNNGGSFIDQFGGGFRSVALERVHGKPFVLSEFNFCPPNQFRMESGPVFAAVAGLQGWDAIFKYSWEDKENLNTPQPIDSYDDQWDPELQASDRCFAALFERGDVKQSGQEQLWQIPANSPAAGAYDAPLMQALFQYQIGSSQTLGDPAGSYPGTFTGAVTSTTGQINGNLADGWLTVATPNNAALVCDSGSNYSVENMTVTYPSGPRTSFWLHSLGGGSSVGGPGHYLFAMIPDVQNAGATFDSAARKVLTAWGSGGWLAYVEQATIKLNLFNASNYKVYALDMAGNRLYQVQTTASGSQLTWTANTSGSNGAQFYYEITDGS